ncbi:MAG TPA: hypothetical protein VF483_07555, partial [Gemmatimonadaceae bacterium]
RSTITDMFSRALELCCSGLDLKDVNRSLSDAICIHTTDIYQKGYNHTEPRDGYDAAIAKSFAGLQRFLAIPIELYSEGAYIVKSSEQALRLRSVTSAMLSAIIRGYGAVRFGARKGWQVLPTSPTSWASYLAFIRHYDLQEILKELEPGDLFVGLLSSVAPTIEAVDLLMNSPNADAIFLPRIGQFVAERKRVELALSFPRNVDKRYLDIHCYLHAGDVGRATLEESIARGANLIVAPLRPDIKGWTDPHDVLRTILVDPTDKPASAVASEALEILHHEIRKYVGRIGPGEAIVTNLAKNFPLDSPTIRQYFHVSRASIRELVRSFETETGVRLWCSVRRSGKTTACQDMGTSDVNSLLISQTMDDTGTEPNAGRFHQEVIKALESDHQIPPTFFMNAVRSCANGPGVEDAGRLIFVLDEYETLFDDLKLRMIEKPRLRYSFVQPLLNQMVAFSQQNLLIFMGQRPDSHYIIMDQNQLSPYVKQDAFPLFSRVSKSGSGISEFDELLQKVMTERCSIDAGFASAVFEETGGHPYLTVNILVDFFDWMIEERRSHQDLELTRGDFERFSREWLRPEHLKRSGNYSLFKKYLEHVLGGTARQQQPWLYVVSTMIRRIALEHHDLGCSERDFATHGKDLFSEFEWEPEDVIVAASRSNFLSIRNGRVKPMIPLLARLAAVTRPRTT